MTDAEHAAVLRRLSGRCDILMHVEVDAIGRAIELLEDDKTPIADVCRALGCAVTHGEDDS